ncbi:alkene reductase [Altererythrobacter sp. BO-6]|uniref:alkene reductase n=1 Tax=Altererythrobacter sp. BO-6 TaxID=2604537 RepID=UPI0013E18A98|nr:alkene reductase [Altererythrobacter sp. BO-6]QIG53778.1 alkene reductase [Altererythrobacter sp. BO-6]
MLQDPVTIGSMRLRNRAVMAPMTRNRATIDEVPTPIMAEYYSQRAADAGLIITECSQVSPQGRGYLRTPGSYSLTQVDGWRPIVQAVQERGAKIFLQLYHSGRQSHPSMQVDGALPVAPSAIKADGQIFTAEGLQDHVTPRALERGEIPGVVEQFANAARNALTAGFDGIELHGAFGYLIDQFLRDGSNQRTDEYGGTIENRSRFLLEIVDAVTQVFPADRVGVRVSPIVRAMSMSDSNPQALFNYLAEQLGKRRIGYLHLLEMGDDPFDWPGLKQRFGGICIANCDYDEVRAEAVLASGRAELVSFARLYLANPDLLRRFALGAPLNQVDPETFYQGEERGYTDYPALNTEN